VVSPLTAYTITAYNNGGSSATTVEIEVDEQTVTFPPIPAKTVCDADFDPGATSAGVVTYTSANTAVATVVAGELHITGPGTSVITASDGTSQPTQTLTVAAAVTPTIVISPSAIDTCQGSVATYSAVITNGGTSPVYQWQLNGQNIGANSPTFTAGNLNNDDQVTCTLTSNAVCTTNATAISNSAAFIVYQPAPPTISILSTATGPVCPGTELDFIATAISAGNSLSYQWQVNGLNAGANSATFSSSSLANGDLVTCILTSLGKCLIDPTAVSNTITVSINPASACIIVIPNAFTPNGDGVNDIWDISALQGYPECTVNIFNRYGAMVYNSVGYPKAWDGTYGGSALPVGTYYYIIDLKNGRKKLAGPVTILR
jgi:gliding motility-associated-like protein